MKDTEQEFSAATWVEVFGLSPRNTKFHILLYILKLYGFVDYEIEQRRAHGGKIYQVYTKVKICNENNYIEIDEFEAPLSDKIEEYKKIHNSDLFI